MYYVYVLKDAVDGGMYYGYTDNVERRVEQHRKGNAQWRLVYYEAFLSEADARDRERSLKHYGQSRTHLKSRIKHSLELQN
jgi:putative endonuclease